MLLGPFLGEVGFELLYWIPAARRLLARHGIARDRVVAFTRGGAGEWYRDFAGEQLEIFDLVAPEEFGSLLERRRAEVGDAKMLSIAEADRDLISAARARLGAVTVMHPIVMYTRLRWIWQGEQPVEDILQLVDFRALAPDDPPENLGLPADYLALRLYFNDCFPDTEENRAFLENLVERIADRHDVVLLSAGRTVDDHVDWKPGSSSRVHDLEGRIDPRENLAIQTAVAARSRGLVTTYGGFSYLGPFLRVPTLGFRARDANPRHEQVLRIAFPREHFAVSGPGAESEIDSFLDRVGEPVRST